MKYKVGDKVRIRSRKWYDKNKDSNGNITFDIDVHFSPKMQCILGKVFTIKKVYESWYDLNETFYSVTNDMIEGLVIEEPSKEILFDKIKSAIIEAAKELPILIEQIEDGAVKISQLEVKEEDLKKGTHVMVTNDINNEAWTLRQYMSNGYCDAFRTDSAYLPPMKFRYIIAFDKFNPNNIEESLKYNIVK